MNVRRVGNQSLDHHCAQDMLQSLSRLSTWVACWKVVDLPLLLAGKLTSRHLVVVYTLGDGRQVAPTLQFGIRLKIRRPWLTPAFLRTARQIVYLVYGTGAMRVV